MTNTSIPLGGILLLDQVEKEYGLFSSVFRGLGKVSDFSRLVKLHVYNKLAYSVSTHQILETYPSDVSGYLGLKEMPSERSLYRAVEETGSNLPVLLTRLQKFLNDKGLTDKTQIIDFSSSYFEGLGGEMGAKGYSRDHRPGNAQITYGLSIGLNGVPAALTIQKGNVQDKKHMKYMLELVSKVCAKNSLLMFDTGANTRANKEKIKSIGCHYLTLRAKKKSAYIPHLFKKEDACECFEVNGRDYYCQKKECDGEYLYVFWCSQLYGVHLTAREKKFERNKKKGNKLLKSREKALPSDKGWAVSKACLQKTLQELENPYITGLEGFFILESSLNLSCKEVLRTYKERDKAEKFIMALKDGLEIRPIRHWNTKSVMGVVFLSFLANTLINLTQKNEEKR
jgi:transposase